MYHFNETEKHILKQLTTLAGSNAMLGNFIIGKVNRSLIEINPSKKTATMILHHYMGNAEDHMDKYKIIYRQNMELLCTSVNLLEYLKRENLIYDYGILHEDTLDDTFHLGFHPEPEMNGVRWPIEDKNLIESLALLSRRVFIPTSDLKNIIDNKYRSFEEIKFRKQMIATWVSIVIAAMFGLYGIFK